MERSDLEATHEEYSLNVNDWKYYIQSYLGGSEYQKGKYLQQYKTETGSEYDDRLAVTPLDNHCKNIVGIYSSFLWRQPPSRIFGAIESEVEDSGILGDADLDGRSFNAMMAEAQRWASIYGHCWAVVDKPRSDAVTRGDERDLGVRPYLSLITPENVLDWKHEREATGRYSLIYFKVREGEDLYRIWTKDAIQLWKLEAGDKRGTLIESLDNPLKQIPAVYIPNKRSAVRVIGVSDLVDIADMQKAVYNELSEIQQLIRISNHPTLVKTPSADASAGAGAIITVEDDMEPALKPYMLEPTGRGLSEIRASIVDKVEAINRIAHLGAVRATETQTKSGVALQTEFQLLNAKLSEKADGLELAEEQIWTLFAEWQNLTWDGLVDYPDSFDIRDAGADLEFYQLAKASGVKSDTLQKGIDKKIAGLILKDDELNESIDEIEAAVTVGTFPIVEEIG